MSSSYSYSSTSYTSSTSTNNSQGQVSGTRSGQATYTDASGQTHVQSAHQNLGEPAQVQQASYDSQGRRLAGGGEGAEPSRIEEAGAGENEGNAGVGNGGVSSGGVSSGGPQVRELDMQDENDRRYLERMEDEYAKREGGA